jgi:hypothetical protein
MDTKSIKAIKLDRNQITDKGVTALCKVLGNLSVKTLDLSFNKIGMLGFNKIHAYAKRNHYIKGINLVGNDIDNKVKPKMQQEMQSMGIVLDV